MPKRIHSSLILVAVFALGIVGGVAGMVWAWPRVRAHYFPHQRQSFVQVLQKSLNLTATQVSQVQAIFQETRTKSDAIHAQFMPQYVKVCEEYSGIRAQERTAFDPLRQQEQSKLQAVLTAQQWNTFQQQSAAAMRGAPRTPQDACQRMMGGPPSGGPHGPGGRGHGHGPGRGPGPPPM